MGSSSPSRTTGTTTRAGGDGGGKSPATTMGTSSASPDRVTSKGQSSATHSGSKHSVSGGREEHNGQWCLITVECDRCVQGTTRRLSSPTKPVLGT
eukprot:4324782-Prymnesium_polylepis.2